MVIPGGTHAQHVRPWELLNSIDKLLKLHDVTPYLLVLNSLDDHIHHVFLEVQLEVRVGVSGSVIILLSLKV